MVQEILENKDEVQLIFQLISKISDNHHRTPDFLDKLDKIFQYLIKDIPSPISYFIPDYTSCIKVGFSGEKWPQFTFPTIIGYPKYNDSSYKICIGNETIQKEGILILKYPIDQGIIINFDDMTKIWQYTFDNVIHTDISNHPVLLTKAQKTPPKYREKMTEIMFETFNVPSFYVQKQPVLSLYSSGRTSGVVLESGYSPPHAGTRVVNYKCL